LNKLRYGQKEEEQSSQSILDLKKKNES